MTQRERAEVQREEKQRVPWTEQQRARALLIGILGVAAIVFLLGINWGLPSREIDQYLFGTSETPWSGDRIRFLTGGRSGDSPAGADVDRNPRGQITEPTRINGTDRERAEIIQRYRLYSYQPDEMITFMALQGMAQRQDIDPRLYQYGGLWIYPVGVMLKIASIVGFVNLQNNLAFYLDNPSAFGRFYIVARLYAAIWGIVGAWAVFWIARRLSSDTLIAAAASLAYVFLPVVMNGAHEAKPHLPGIVLMLLAIIAAVKWIETGWYRWWLTAGALCGCAAGMVLSAWVIFVLPIVMVFFRRQDFVQRLAVAAGAIGVGIAVYVLTNPFVLINLLAHCELLRSNLGNSRAMYHPSASGLPNAIKLIGLGTSPLLALFGVAGGVVVVIVKRQEQRPFPPVVSAIAFMLLIPTLIVLVQFILLAGGKPPEYARFALLIDITLLLLAAWAVALIARQPVFKQLLAGFIVASTLPYGLAYCRAFVRDGLSTTSRTEAAEELFQTTNRILLYSEPAPYNCPPVNVLRRDIVLIPPGWKQTLAGDEIIYPVDVPIENSSNLTRLPFRQAPGALDQFTTPITWANKTFAAESTPAAP